MATQNQPLGCKQGASYDFRIIMQPGDDLTGATVIWSLSEGTFDGARTLLTKSSAGGSVFPTLDVPTGLWGIVISLAPVDTAGIGAAVLYHEAKALLPGGAVKYIEGGLFVLAKSVDAA